MILCFVFDGVQTFAPEKHCKEKVKLDRIMVDALTCDLHVCPSYSINCQEKLYVSIKNYTLTMAGDDF